MSARAPRGSATLNVEIIGLGPLRSALRPLLEPEITVIIDAANRNAARAYAKALRSAASPVSKHMARAVQVKRARTGKPGWVVGSKRKVAFFWHMVILGTRAHGPRKAKSLIFVPGWNPYLGASSHGVGNKVVRTKRVAGVPANPIVDRVGRDNERRIADLIEDQFVRETGL